MEIIAESDLTLDGAVAAGSFLVTSALQDAQPRLDRYELDGTPLGRLDLAGGAVVGLNGEPEHPDLFVGLSSVTVPTEVYRVDAGRGRAAHSPSWFADPPQRSARRRCSSCAARPRAATRPRCPTSWWPRLMSILTDPEPTLL